ncbi:CapA family protein [Virgibacillus sp. NKC19-3]|nr:CapA family protein [Virgibacillus sp. NKC19-3]
MKRILAAIAEAKRQADFVLVSIHSHEMAGEELEKPADFLKDFSRRCINGGADSIIGHGPHILRGIEI